MHIGSYPVDPQIATNGLLILFSIKTFEVNKDLLKLLGKNLNVLYIYASTHAISAQSAVC